MQKIWPSRWYQRLLVVLILLYLLYALLSAVLVATWGKGKLVDTIHQITGKPVSVKHLLFNPFTNSIYLTGLQISGTNGDIISLGEFSANLELLPLVQGELYLRQVLIDTPQLHIVRRKDGDFNLQHLVKPQNETTGDAAEDTSSETETRKGLPLIPVIAEFDLHNGKVSMTDQRLASQPNRAITNINVRVHGLSLASGHSSPFQIAMALPGDGHVAINGKVTPIPLSLQASGSLQNVMLAQANPWLKPSLNAKLAGGVLQLHTGLTLKGQKLHLRGQATINGFALDNLKEEPLAAFNKLAISDVVVNRNANEAKTEKPSVTAQGAVALEGLKLALNNPWVQPAIQGNLTTNALHLQADMTLKSGQVHADGKAGLDGVVLDNTKGISLVSFDKLTADGFSLDGGAHKVKLDKLAVSGMDSQFVVYPDGSTSLDHLFLAAKGSTSRPSKAESKNTAANADADKQATPWQVNLKHVALSAKRLRFTDRSVKPAYQVDFKPLALSLGPLDTAGGKTKLALNTKLGGYAPLSAKGTLSLFSDQPDVNLDIHLRGYDMTHLSPYTGRYIGHLVDKGHLGISSNVALTGTLLKSQSRISANSFYLGKDVKSKEAVKAPVKFGLSILRNRKGNISLPLKVAGDLSDPSVSVHGLILQALKNVLIKAATAPLSMLSLLTGNDDLQQVAFDAGKHELTAKQIDGLSSLADTLQQRPALKMELSGSSSAADAALLTKQGKAGKALEKQLQQLAKERAKALKLALVKQYSIAAKRLFLGQPRTGSTLAGVALSVIKN